MKKATLYSLIIIIILCLACAMEVWYAYRVIDAQLRAEESLKTVRDR